MTKAKYVLRVFFDAGSGVLLWSGNSAAHERFGYPVNFDDLPLPDATRSRVAAIIVRYDTSINWDAPSSPTLWTNQECEQFNCEVSELIGQLRRDLGSEFELDNETRPLVPGE